MFQRFCRQITPIAQKSISAQSLIRTSSLISVRNATLLVELRSGRVGSMTIDNQKDLDKLLERTGSVGLLSEDAPEDADQVNLITKVDSIKDDVVYQVAYAADEAEAFEDYDENMDLEEGLDANEMNTK